MNNSAISEETWDDFEKRIFTTEEIVACESRVAISLEIHDARRRGIGKRELEKLSGVDGAVIARMEEDPAKARLGPVLKVLTALRHRLPLCRWRKCLKGMTASSRQTTANSIRGKAGPPVELFVR